MDPYLESHWADVHHNLITFAQGVLNDHLPADLIARVEERVFVESPSTGGRRAVEHPAPYVESSVSNGDVAVAEPLVVHLADESVTQGFIEILDAGSGNRVVTVIEVLSPANKHSGDGQDQYRQKQRELHAGGVNLVEIDLLRAGQRVLSVATDRLPPAQRTSYMICVRRACRPGQYEIFPITVRQRLPRFRIPLRPDDADVILDLQDLLARCYRNGRYHTLDYTKDAEPPLRGEDARWADELLRGAGKR